VIIEALKKHYKNHPFVIAGSLILGGIAAIVSIVTFIDIIWKAYNAYNTYSSGTQILIMTVVNILITISIVLLVTAYLSLKINDLKKK
jgi:hypothetical protein